MLFRTILVDDEALALRRLERLLESYADRLQIIGQAQDGAEAVALIDRLKPDLVFLDIQMPELNGFEVLQKLNHVPVIIFSTAFDQYALDAFETNSIDYLLKPIDPQRLDQAIEKLIRLTESDPYRFQLKQLLNHLNMTPKRIKVRSGDEIRLLALDQIVFLRASHKLVELHTQDQDYLMDQSLNQLESELPSQDFVRIHRSVIINLNHVDKISKMFNGAYQVRMKDHKHSDLPISRKSKLGLS